MTELLRERTCVDEADLELLHRLVGEWQLLADLSFADLLLWVPVAGTAGATFLAVAQLRPTTGPTAYQEDRVGELAGSAARPQLANALREGRICREGDPLWTGGIPVREEAIPVRRGDRVIAVVSRDTNLTTERTPSRLDIAYLQTASDLARMIAEGAFPYPEPEVADGEVDGPRVGDGLIRLDGEGTVVFASPNAVSAYRRLGLAGDLVGRELAGVTASLSRREPAQPGVAGALAAGRRPGFADVETEGATVRLRALPLRHSGRHIGALVLLHDVTELRRRDRALSSKDATIREIHHRVKNNLQTVAALLRLQARRLDVPEARAALAESERRVASIAMVHETLALTLDETVDFDVIADRLFALVGETATSAGPARLARHGHFGTLPAPVATPLAMALTELLQNAVEHGTGTGEGRIEVRVARDGAGLTVDVDDDGVGLPEGFDLAGSPRLGLQIVRTLVEGERGGRLSLDRLPGGGTRARVRLPLPAVSGPG
jgi:two-component sensor histidine kinase